MFYKDPHQFVNNYIRAIFLLVVFENSINLLLSGFPIVGEAWGSPLYEAQFI